MSKKLLMLMSLIAISLASCGDSKEAAKPENQETQHAEDMPANGNGNGKSTPINGNGTPENGNSQ